MAPTALRSPASFRPDLFAISHGNTLWQEVRIETWKTRTIPLQEAIPLFDGTLTYRAYGTWAGVTAPEGELQSSFSNLRLSFTPPVADGGQPGLTTPEELLLGAAIAAFATAFMELSRQMVLDVASLQIEGELTRSFDEIEGHQISRILLKPEATLRTGLGFEKVHDMFRRASSLAKQRSPVLRALDAGVKILVEPSYR